MNSVGKVVLIVLLQIPIIYMVYWLFIQPFSAKKNTPLYLTTSTCGFIILILVTFTLITIMLFGIYHSMKVKTQRNCILIVLLLADLFLTFTAAPLFLYVEIHFMSSTSIETLLRCLQAEVFCSMLGNVFYTSSLFTLIICRIYKLGRNDGKEFSIGCATLPLTLAFIYSITISTICALCFQHYWIPMYTVMLEFILPMGFILVFLIIISMIKRIRKNAGIPEGSRIPPEPYTDMDYQAERNLINGRSAFTFNGRSNTQVRVPMNHQVEIQQPAANFVDPTADQLLYGLVFIYIIFRGPYFILLIIKNSTNSLTDYIIRKLYTIGIHLYYTKSVTNPILYIILDQSFRHSFLKGWDIITGSFKRNKLQNQILNVGFQRSNDQINVLNAETTNDEARLID